MLVRGELSPGGTGASGATPRCCAGCKRRTLAKLRDEIAPVDAATFARFLRRWHGLGEQRAGPRRLEEALAQLEGARAAVLRRSSACILPARVPRLQAARCSTSSARAARSVWIGCGALGPRDGRVAIYRARSAGKLLPVDAASPRRAGRVHAALLDHLERRGASLPHGARTTRAGRRPRAEIEAALWDLVWAGLVTNDTFAPLRALGTQRARRAGRGRDDLAGGRWSLVAQARVADVADTDARVRTRERCCSSATASSAATRSTPRSVAGGFGPVYPVLRAMEDAGRVRRGHFVDGLAGAQFALPGAVDRLRAAREPAHRGIADADARVLAAIDPANPYGALLPWPDARSRVEGRPRRVAGAWVILVDGTLVLYASANARQLLTFVHAASDERSALPAAFRALHRLPRGARPRLVTIETIDDVPVRESPHLAALEAAGFVGDYRGLTARTRFGP